ncbi:uncharacterized protein LOC112171517 [Rosa chinensis]|uniref:uncharacterized protein LOC112171517 n=1 Tax=Rosa chinensis TaxID=74649 RepID=UPI000D092991|nr:uncharacterized protein LOC112171517 [Rosa chinensis]
MTGFYGYARTAECDLSWQLLKDLGDLDSLPWVIIGDFKEILNNGEKINGPPRVERQMRGFREALGYCDLLDLGFQDSKATWWNAETHLSLDRAVCTLSRLDVFGYAKVTHLPPSDSDHISILLQKNTFRLRQQQMLGVQARMVELLDSSATTSIQDEKRMLMNRLETLLSQEEAFFRQRAKVTWLKAGDRNIGFFHRKAANRKRKNAIHGLYDEQGVWSEDDDGVEHIVTSYFTKMFTASPVDMVAMNTILEAIQPNVMPTMNAQLCSEYTKEEIRCALFQMYPTKSPSPDGMPPLFFQHYWEVNFTHICLIPKVNNPESMSDLRPIAPCNVLYKIFSKAIANRLKVLLPDIISPFQSAFVPGRLITDNILVANKIAHFVHNKREGNDGHVALKLDLSKAYDRMECLFLRKVMERFGFTRMWIEFVMQCLCSVRFSFLIRGKPRGLVTPSKGLRQGDPLSPYLFLLGVEDDSMLYAQASLYVCYEIQDVIETYGRASGQLVNFDKSSVVFRKMFMKIYRVKLLLIWECKLWIHMSDLEQMCARFWWGCTEDKRKIHWKAWGSLCHPNEEGELGFQSLIEFNMAMLAKQAWRIANDHESLIARVYKARYFPGSSFWLAPVLGISTLVPNIGLPLVNENMTINELLHEPGRWDEGKIRAVFAQEGAEAILNIPLSRRLVNDRVAWRLEKKGEFSVKIAYRYAFSISLERPGILENVTSQFWKKIWHTLIFQARLRSTGGIRRDAGKICWKSPPLGYVKLNTDRAFISETSASGIGLVMRDNLGQFLACEGKPVRGLLSAEHAELLACKAAIDLIVDRSLQPAIVETDSLIVQQQLVGVGNNLSRLGRIYEDLSFNWMLCLTSKSYILDGKLMWQLILQLRKCF